MKQILDIFFIFVVFKSFCQETIKNNYIKASVVKQEKSKKPANSHCITFTKKNELSCAEGGYNYRFTNSCNEILDVFYAIERNNGDWSTGVFGSLKPQKDFQVFVCKTNDNVVCLTRKPGANIKFPTYSELKKLYAK